MVVWKRTDKRVEYTGILKLKSKVSSWESTVLERKLERNERFDTCINDQ